VQREAIEKRRLFCSWLQFLFLDSDQAVVGSHVDIAVALRQCGHIEGGQTLVHRRPALRLSIEDVQPFSESAGKNVTQGDQHGIGIDDDVPRGLFKTAEVTSAVQP